MISNQQVLQLIHGCVESKEIGEYIAFYHCNSYQIKHTAFDDFLHVRAPFSTSVTLEFYTDATKFGFDVKKVYIGSNDTFDLYIDNVAYEFRELETIADGDSVEFTLPAGNKRILLYFPNDSELLFKNFWIEGNYEPVLPRTKTMVCYGDSITNGYGSFRSSLTYVHVMNRQMHFNIYNHGIGGYWYDENFISPTKSIEPDYILVSLGTNQIRSDDRFDRIDKFYKNLFEIYPNAKFFVITPIWRGDRPEALTLIPQMRDYLFNKLKDNPNVFVIDGYKLVPHMDYFFADKLHPNAIGMEYYGNNLAKILKEVIDTKRW